MARPKTTSGYPQVFFDIVAQVSGSTKPFVLKLEDNKTAQAQRFRFYDFLKACRHSHDPKDKEIGVMGAGIIFQVEGSELTIRSRDHTLEAHDLVDALKEWGGSVSGEATEPPDVKQTMPRSSVVIDPKMSEEIGDNHEAVIEKFLES